MKQFKAGDKVRIISLQRPEEQQPWLEMDGHEIGDKVTIGLVEKTGVQLFPMGKYEYIFHPDNFELIDQERTFTLSEVGAMLNDVMNLGMKLRQDQLNGYTSRSGNEVLENWLTNYLNQTK